MKDRILLPSVLIFSILIIPFYAAGQSKLYVPSAILNNTQPGFDGIGINLDSPEHPLHIYETEDRGTALKIDIEQIQVAIPGGGFNTFTPDNAIQVEYYPNGLSSSIQFAVTRLGEVHSGYFGGTEQIVANSRGLGVYRTSNNKAGLDFNGSDPRVFWNSSSRDLSFVNLSTSKTPLTLHRSGKVGVNTTNFFDNHDLYVGGSVYIEDDEQEEHSLWIEGSAIAEEIFVKLSAYWPDYVFSDSYNLMPLSDLERYIAEEGHLPGMQKASVIEEKGLPLGETERVLTEKVEELTLYILQLKAEIDELKKQQASE